MLVTGKTFHKYEIIYKKIHTKTQMEKNFLGAKFLGSNFTRDSFLGRLFSYDRGQHQSFLSFTCNLFDMQNFIRITKIRFALKSLNIPDTLVLKKNLYRLIEHLVEHTFEDWRKTPIYSNLIGEQAKISLEIKFVSK